jgi:N-formylglutamate amidohydrolase
VTCLDERGQPELVAAVFRMSLGENRTVDNIHAGGLACRVSLDGGELGLASDLGSDARLGWWSEHPDTGARIEGTHLPYWGQVRALVVEAHAAFTDRVLIGWDVAITDDRPIMIEGNRGPDMDLMQRFMELGFYHEHRLTELIAHHLRARGHIASDARPVSGANGSPATVTRAAPSSRAAARSCRPHNR